LAGNNRNANLRILHPAPQLTARRLLQDAAATDHDHGSTNDDHDYDYDYDHNYGNAYHDYDQATNHDHGSANDDHNHDHNNGIANHDHNQANHDHGSANDDYDYDHNNGTANYDHNQANHDQDAQTWDDAHLTCLVMTHRLLSQPYPERRRVGDRADKRRC